MTVARQLSQQWQLKSLQFNSSTSTRTNQSSAVTHSGSAMHWKLIQVWQLVQIQFQL